MMTDHDAHQMIKDRLTHYQEHCDLHEKNQTILKIIYYALGLLSTASSTLLTILTSISMTTHNSDIVVSELGLSFTVLLVNSILNFAKIEEKMSKHRDMRIQYTALKLDVDDFLVEPHSDQELHTFLKTLVEKQKLLIGYETNTFCFK